MKKHLNLTLSLLACAAVAASLVSCGSGQSSVSGGQKLWEGETIQHKNFKDLGNYVIELPDYTDPASLERGLEIANQMADNGGMPKVGCTAMAKRNSKGEVIIGRNMDLDISQKPGYVYQTTYGKYKNFCVTYVPGVYLDYPDLQKEEEMDGHMLDMVPMFASDCMNEKGLYIEMNLREENIKTVCYGMHSTRGELTRADGKPWSELRAPTTVVPQLVSQNCATVKEAVDFIKNSYDWYTLTPGPGLSIGVGQSNMAFMIGDATGEYGLIEIAQDEIFYIPYQYGHANFYINPVWAAIDLCGAGMGRLEMVSDVIGGPETLEEAMKAMEPIMWRNETLWLGESHRVEDGSRLHPYYQIAFQDNQGNMTLDWRSEYVGQWPVLDDGRMVIEPETYEEAKLSTGYDAKIKEYIDDALKTGRLVMDNGSFKFTVNGQKLSLAQLKAKWEAYNACTDKVQREQLYPFFKEYRRLLQNQNNYWTHDEFNFEAMKAMAYARIHLRRNAQGEFDVNSMSKYEKLLAFYGNGVEKDEKPLRDAADIWTTSLNVGVNCAQKEIKIRFWENDEVIYHFKW